MTPLWVVSRELISEALFRWLSVCVTAPYMTTSYIGRKQWTELTGLDSTEVDSEETVPMIALLTRCLSVSSEIVTSVYRGGQSPIAGS